MTSWITSLFASSQSNSQSVEIHRSTNSVASHSHEEEKDKKVQRGRKKRHFETIQEGEGHERARPPYVHVSLYQFSHMRTAHYCYKVDQ